MSEIRLVYFDIRGMAEPIRWMLAMSDVPFTDERIPLDAWVGGRKRSSFEGKLGSKREGKDEQRKSLSADQTVQRFKSFIGQLPILYFDDLIVTQTMAVVRFLSRRYGFNGKTAREEAKADEIADLVYDLRLQAVDYLNSGFKTATPDIVRHTVFRDFSNEPDSSGKRKMRDDLSLIYFPLYFTKFASILAESGGDYIAGANLTYGDLFLANFLEIVQDLVDPNCLDEFPTLKDLMARIYSHPKIEEWRRAQNAVNVEYGTPDVG